MSQAPGVRRTDRLMSDARARAFLAAGFCGRLGTTGPDGWPYVVPLLYVWMDGEIHVHNAGSRGDGGHAPGSHLGRNVAHDARVCFEVDEAGPAFPYGRFECDTALAYASVIAFGTVRVVEDRDVKARFFALLMSKYADASWDRPKEFFPRLDAVTVYAITVERLTGKETVLPGVAERWPAVDRTRSPGALPPADPRT